MGDRANIVIKETEGGTIFLYTHWRGYKVRQVLAAALERGRGRWSDEAYLARIIFSEMVRDDIDASTGYGISTYVGDGDSNMLAVEIRTGLVHDSTTDVKMDFEAFIAEHAAISESEGTE